MNVLATSNRRADQLNHIIRTGSPQTFGVLNRKWVVGRNGEVYHYQYYDPRRQELNALSAALIAGSPPICSYRLPMCTSQSWTGYATFKGGSQFVRGPFRKRKKAARHRTASRA